MIIGEQVLFHRDGPATAGELAFIEHVHQNGGVDIRMLGGETRQTVMPHDSERYLGFNRERQLREGCVARTAQSLAIEAMQADITLLKSLLDAPKKVTK